MAIAEDNSQRNNSQEIKTRPAPPPRVPPNKVKPGGGLDFERLACDSNSSNHLRALVPVDNPILTAKTHPSFLFYIPDSPEQIAYGEFSLLTANEKKRIYQTTITGEEIPGIIKIDLPSQPALALQTEQNYHWYLKVYCRDNLANQTSNFIDVNGWIRRSSDVSQIRLTKEYKPFVFWYDELALVAETLIANPNDLVARDRWLELMKYIEAEHLVDLL